MFKFITEPKYIMKTQTAQAGVVYYANYLKFIERARTNMIQELEHLFSASSGSVYGMKNIMKTILLITLFLSMF